MDNEELCNALRTAFSSEYAFLIKAQDIHWNIQGRVFYQDHLLFERIYQEVEEAIDPFAENLRKSRCFVPAGLSKMAQLSIIDDLAGDDLPPEQLYQTLLSDSDKMADLFASLFDLAEQFHEHGLSNFVADRQDAHRQHSWMLRASLVR